MKKEKGIFVIPAEILRIILGFMSERDPIILSFMSRRFCRVVKTMRMQGKRIFFNFHPNQIDMGVEMMSGEEFYFPLPFKYLGSRNHQLSEIWLGGYVEDTRKWQFRNFFDQLKNVINHTEVDTIRFEAYATNFNLQSVLEDIGNPTCLHINRIGSDQASYDIVNHFDAPVVNLHVPMLERVPKRILSRKFDELHICKANYEAGRGEAYFYLEDILVTNAKNVYLDQIWMTLKDMNQFLKRLRQGSNRELKYLTVVVDDEITPENLLEGLQTSVATTIPQTPATKYRNKRNFYLLSFNPVEYFDYVTVDGRTVTVDIRGRDVSIYVRDTEVA
ncbi:hypothetical protein B9Z55_026577 [Caenorhabditis nigoni]|uniref:F-box domain-containing protein n=1 Tax=Caenorhabditis nigoni TaxID=1611254 RepID=A0A2G5T3R2_9PELO|nr:hypothetical protein B9Z55_026577 [Caenorhabditis nigoni]